MIVRKAVHSNVGTAPLCMEVTDKCNPLEFHRPRTFWLNRARANLRRYRACTARRYDTRCTNALISVVDNAMRGQTCRNHWGIVVRNVELLPAPPPLSWLATTRVITSLSPVFDSQLHRMRIQRIRPGPVSLDTQKHPLDLRAHGISCEQALRNRPITTNPVSQPCEFSETPVCARVPIAGSTRRRCSKQSEVAL